MSLGAQSLPWMGALCPPALVESPGRALPLRALITHTPSSLLRGVPLLTSTCVYFLVSYLRWPCRGGVCSHDGVVGFFFFFEGLFLISFFFIFCFGKQQQMYFWKQWWSCNEDCLGWRTEGQEVGRSEGQVGSRFNVSGTRRLPRRSRSLVILASVK